MVSSPQRRVRAAGPWCRYKVRQERRTPLLPHFGGMRSGARLAFFGLVMADAMFGRKLQQDTAVDESVDDGGGGHRVFEDLLPLAEGEVGGDDDVKALGTHDELHGAVVHDDVLHVHQGEVLGHLLDRFRAYLHVPFLYYQDCHSVYLWSLLTAFSQ